MNTPNKLTMLRIILIPFFVVFLLGNFSAWSKWMALAIFVIASLTDMLDGYLARRDNLVTNFGKFMDPLADKLLVCSAMICLVDMSRIPSWIVIIIIGREFVISGFRLIASDNGVVIAANYWGKCKRSLENTDRGGAGLDNRRQQSAGKHTENGIFEHYKETLESGHIRKALYRSGHGFHAKHQGSKAQKDGPSVFFSAALGKHNVNYAYKGQNRGKG